MLKIKYNQKNYLRLIIKKLLSPDFIRCQGHVRAWDLSSCFTSASLTKLSLVLIQVHRLVSFLLMLDVG